MSYTFVIKKGGIEIFSLGTGHPMAVAFQNKPYDRFEPMPRSAFADARHILMLQDESLADDYEVAEKILAYSSEEDTLWNSAINMRDIKRQRKAVSDAKVMVDMLEMIWAECGDDQSNTGLEWGVV